jgi:hypothetical protein
MGYFMLKCAEESDFQVPDKAVPNNTVAKNAYYQVPGLMMVE